MKGSKIGTPGETSSEGMMLLADLLCQNQAEGASLSLSQFQFFASSLLSAEQTNLHWAYLVLQLSPSLWLICW